MKLDKEHHQTYIYIYIHMILHEYITDSLLLALYDAQRNSPNDTLPATYVFTANR